MRFALYPMQIMYFVHDLNDPAVARRVAMLHAAGMEAKVAGFWRGAAPPSGLDGACVLALGRTYDGALLHRAASSLTRAMFPAPILAEAARADLLMARNLEMLAIAVSVRRKLGHELPIVYEVLDIHRLLVSNHPVSRALREFERALLRDVNLVLISSPAFQREYFEPYQFAHRALPCAVVENKLLHLDDGDTCTQQNLTPGPPWRIGWLGMLRCRRSLEILGCLAKRRPDLVEIRMSGRPTEEVNRDLEKISRCTPHLKFDGPYTSADLARLYCESHFNWAIDYFEEGLNSRWLLPNRIYEGGYYDAVSLAQAGTETANWLEKLGLGVVFDDPAKQLECFLEELTPASYAQMKAACRRAPRSVFAADAADCKRLRESLESAMQPALQAVS